METLEILYAAKVKEFDETVAASRGCNQYKHVQGCDEADDSWTEEPRKQYEDLRHDIEEVAYKTFSRLARNGYVDGIYFDGENFHTDNQEGRATLLYSSSDIDDFLEENDMQEATVDDQAELFMSNHGLEVFEAIDWDEVEENKKANS